MNELTYRRTHQASPELLFDCMTMPAHLTHFWGPVGTSTPEDRIVCDLRPGGDFVTVMVSDADGSEHEMRASYVEVDRPHRLAWLEPASGMTTTVTFVDQGDGTTEVVTHQTHVPEAYLSPEARAGFASSLDEVQRYLDRQAHVATELTRLADVVDGIDGAWDAPSLCEGWRVREVVAHLTMPARYDEAAFLAELEADGWDFTALSNRIAERDAELPAATLLANLRDPVLHAWQPPGGGAAGALNHAVIHSLDITVPLGIDRPRPDADIALRLVRDDLLAGGAAHFGVDPATVAADASPVEQVLGLTGRRLP